MRVITGKYKGRHFDIPRTFKARPTTDFAKENLFNVLQGYVDLEGCNALDLFSGTGGISYELLSRGCSRVVCVEQNPQHFAFIRQCLDKLHDTAAVPLRMDVFRYIARCRETFDLIFADPPYQLPEMGDLPTAILSRNLLREGGLLVVEHGKEHTFNHLPDFVEHRNYGSVNFSLFRQNGSEG